MTAARRRYTRPDRRSAGLGRDWSSCRKTRVGSDPRCNSPAGAFQKVLVHAVVGHVAGYHETDRRHMQDCGVICVGVADLNSDQALALELETVRGNGLIDDRTGGMRPGKSTSHIWARPAVACSCITAIVPSVAYAMAPGKR